jgi:hypothetical protein
LHSLAFEQFAQSRTTAIPKEEPPHEFIHRS